MDSGNQGTVQDPQSGHLKITTTDEQVDAIHHMILDERYLTKFIYGKVISFIFLLDSEGVIIIDYLEKIKVLKDSAMHQN